MVMKWLGGGKPDHPLAEEKGAKEVFAALKEGEPAQAIEDIRHWVESVVATEGFKPERRAELVLQLDEAAQPHQQKIAREYLSNPALSKFQEARLWGAQLGLWTDLGTAYAALLEQAAADPGTARSLKAQLPLLVVRAVRALAARIKWHALHYEPAGAAAWASLCKVYAFAEARKLQRDAVPLYPPVALSVSAEREFAKALLLAASSPDCLMPRDIDLAERLVAQLGAAFVLSDAHQPQVTHHWVDLAAGTAPKRLTQAPPPVASLRFFSAGTAHAQLDEMIRVAEGGALPSGLNLGVACEAPRLLGVLRHLKTYWAATPPVRKHDRYAVEHRLTVVNGLAGVLARVGEGAAPPEAKTWVTQNISAGGIGALVGDAQAEGVGIGKLVGLSVEGGSGSCSVGVVRRCNRLPDKRSSVGIRTFAKESFPIALGGGGHDALLLNDGRALRDEVLVCLPEGAFDKRSSPTIAFDGGNYLLMPVGVSESGDDFEVVRYRAIRQG
jgi:hypothetical protein